jgi:hypothetical protein
MDFVFGESCFAAIVAKEINGEKGAGRKGMEDVFLSCYFGEVRKIGKSGVDRLDVRTIEHADSGAGRSRMHVSAQAVDYEVFAGVSGIGGDDRGDSIIFNRRRGDSVGGNGSVTSFSRTTLTDSLL